MTTLKTSTATKPEVVLEMKDMQGLIVRGYKELDAATYLLLQIKDAEKAKNYLKIILKEITPAIDNRPQSAMHLAFTWAGISLLKVPESEYEFSREFREGMTEGLRSSLLGDVNHNAPDTWKWGGPKTGDIHILLFCFAKDQTMLDELLNVQKKALDENDILIVEELKTCKSKNSKEHFGFQDGISQPAMKGLHGSAKKEEETDPVKAGEFVLGYRNEYDNYTSSPLVKDSSYPKNDLPKSRVEGFKDLGKNGTYLVFRQMKQNVFQFWKYLKENSKEPAIDQIQAAINLGAKMVGRWPGGAPLAVSGYDDPGKNDLNKFSYLIDDPNGMRCPFGAHIRRTNPRDQLFSRRKDEPSINMIRKHRIIRRGRIFGKPIVASMNPEDILKLEKEDGEERGIHFICLAGHISRQFEFIQNVWVNNPVFADLNNDADPIISSGQNNKNDFTCQASPLRRKYKDIPHFTQVIGGAYFFLPGIKALNFIANC